MLQHVYKFTLKLFIMSLIVIGLVGCSLYIR